MATATLNVTSVISATGWTGASVANLSASDDARATDGVAGEFIYCEVDNAPADFDTLNSVTLHVEARTQGSINRAKQITMGLYDSGDTLLNEESTGDLTATDANYASTAFSRSDSKTTVDGWRLRMDVTEGGGMPDSATVEIDRMWITIDYNVLPAPSGTGSQNLQKASQSGAATEKIPASAAMSLPGPTQSANGVMQPSATATQNLPGVAQAASADETISASAADNLAALTQAGIGSEAIVATGASALVSITQAAVVTMLPEGQGAALLAPLGQAGTGAETIPALGANNLGAVSQAAVGNHAQGIAGAGASTIGPVSQAATGIGGAVAQAAQVLAAPVQQGNASERIEATAGQNVSAPSQLGQGAEAAIATAAQLFAGLAQNAVGVEIFSPSGAQALALLSQAGVATHTGGIVLDVPAGRIVTPDLTSRSASVGDASRIVTPAAEARSVAPAATSRLATPGATSRSVTEPAAGRNAT